jgi:hypothetical protein
MAVTWAGTVNQVRRTAACARRVAPGSGDDEPEQPSAGRIVIDQGARRTLALGLRRLVTGQITNDEFEDRVRPLLRSHDPGVREAFWGAWMLFSDLENYRLKGAARLTRMAKREVARWIVFLDSDLRYEWRVLSGWRALRWVPLDLATLGLSLKIRRRRWRSGGEFAVWPFRRWSEYHAALRQPVFLAGARHGAG